MGNISKDRTGTVAIFCNGTQTNIDIVQKAVPAGQELTYRIPVIFHVLYKDKSDPLQYIDTRLIQQVLANVNQYYDRGIPSPQAVMPDRISIWISTYPKRTKRATNSTRRSGIYISWNEMPIDCESFMESSNSKILNLLWDMNKYINVMLYNFAEVDGGTILGISHLLCPHKGRTTWKD